jgi:hypothetical protein
VHNCLGIVIMWRIMITPDTDNSAEHLEAVLEHVLNLIINPSLELRATCRRGLLKRWQVC